MAFGQKAGTGRPRGRPPKDPQLRAQYDEQVRGYSSDSKARKIDSFDSPRGSVLDVQLAHQNAEDLDGVLQDLRARYEKGIDDRVAEAVREREAIQAQFDRLKELRVTQSEKTLAEVKKASDARIRRWKQRAEHAEHRLTELEEHGGGGEPSGRVKQLEDQLAALQRELASVQDEREALATQSKAPRASDDDLAIRRLYEDLTGFTVTEVERAEPGSDFRRFHLLFSGANYHETQQRIGSHPARSTSTAEVRNDLIYIPYLDDERDAALLASTRVPDHFLQQIKFDRAVTTNFLATLLQALRK